MMIRESAEIVTDAALVGACCAYAQWLDTHKEQEPDKTWLEVVVGVGMVLTAATAHGMIRGGSWQEQQWRVLRAFAIGGMPIIVGEVAQALRGRQERRHYSGIEV